MNERDFRREVTDRIIEMLEKGTAPWQKPWDPSKAVAEMPQNPTTGKAYRGGNAVHLMAVAASRGYEDPRWLTYRQAQAEGWQVRKGEKGTAIEFWQFPSGTASAEETEPVAKENRVPLHRTYTVFNAAQIDGMPEHAPRSLPEWEVVQNGERILAGAGAAISHDQHDRAFYNRASNRIHLPPKAAFADPASYYGTALHELAHWTGHPDRLNRETLTGSRSFGDPNYAREELRAELASLFLSAQRGIPHDPEQHAAYVGSWIEALRKDKNEIFRASKDAAAATDYLLERELQLERETSEHVATYDADNGAVNIVEKNTATETRTLLEPSAESAQLVQEEILDGVVDGKPAPNGTGIDAAKALVEARLGPGARTYEAHRDSGRYEGPVIGQTGSHWIQLLTPRAAAIHRLQDIAGVEVNPDRALLISYNNEQATVGPARDSVSRDPFEMER